MKYRNIGLKMCMMSLVMIGICIPNQIMIANAEEGSQELTVIETKTKKEWEEESTKLNIFPESIEPGDEGDYGFIIKNNTEYKMEYTIEISESEIITNETHNKEGNKYPIEYQLYNVKDEGSNLLGEGWKDPEESLEGTIIYGNEIEQGKSERYVLRWRFKEEDSLYSKGTYTVKLLVDSTQVINNDNNNNNNNGNNNNNSNNGNNSNSNNSTNNGNNSNTNNGNNNSNSNTNNNQGNNNSDNLINNNGKDTISSKDNTNNKGKENISSKKVKTSDITTPVIYVAMMILSIGIILLVKSRREK